MSVDIQLKKILDDVIVDFRNNSKKSFIVLFFYRMMHYCFIHRLRWMVVILNVIKHFVYLIMNINAQISFEAEIGSDIRFPHSASMVVISSHAVIEDHQVIFHNVTIGINEKFPIEKRRVVIRNNCYLSVGCKVISCCLENNCKLGPNAVAYYDLPANTILVSKSEIISR